MGRIERKAGLDTDEPTPAGWLDDPNDPSHERYWDGQAWTNKRRRRALPPVRDRPPKRPGTIGPVELLVAILLPPIGIIWGIVMLGRNEVGPGLAMLITGALAWLVAYMLFVA